MLLALVDGTLWPIDEPCFKALRQWKHFYVAKDSVGDTVEFWLAERRDSMTAKRLFRGVLKPMDGPEHRRITRRL
ncbi:DDE-type integrase/transposase/recombinase [Bradyrhizobium sp. UFLA05-109]